MALLEIKNISKNYIVGSNTLKVLEDINENIDTQEFVALCGPSGAGKSTLLHLIGALDYVTSGEIFFDGIDIAKKSESELNQFRSKEIGFIFQSSYLLDSFTALENVMMPRLLLGDDKIAIEQRARDVIEKLGMSARLNHYPSELSGGEEQRIAVARALINSPRLILADEPTGNLDRANSDQVIKILSSLKEESVAVIIVTHDERIAKSADRIIRLEKI